MATSMRPLTRARRKAQAKPPRMSALLGLQRVDLFKGLDSYTLREIAADVDDAAQRARLLQQAESRLGCVTWTVDATSGSPGRAMRVEATNAWGGSRGAATA